MAHVLVTGGAGYIGSLLVGLLLGRGHRVTVLDDLLFGGETLLAHWHHPHFRFVKGDVSDSAQVDRALCGASPCHAVVHLAAIVGFPACEAVGRAQAWRTNVEATQCLFAAAEAARIERFLFASTYKIAAEQYLLAQAPRSRCAPLVFRFATLFGVSPRTRFDLIVNQFVLEALTKGELVIYQRGYSRSFVHVRDVVDGILLALAAPEARIRGQVYNLGSDQGNATKDEIVRLVQKHVPGLKITYKDLSFDGDMRDITVSFARIRRELGFVPQISVEQGIVEVRDALRLGLIRDGADSRYRNAHLIVQ
jgi:nucleoside-diphosphate-sugar epimerase